MLLWIFSGLLQKIENLIKYPHSTRAGKIPVQKRVTIQAEKLDKERKHIQDVRRQERERRSMKFSRPLPPIDSQDDHEHVLMTETGDLSLGDSQRTTRPAKYTVVVN